jgi:hypothetical protein
MPGPEIAVEEAVPLIGLDMAINSIIVVLFLWALKTVWQQTFEPLILGIANATKIDAHFVKLDPLKKLRDVDAKILKYLDDGISTGQNAMGFWFHQTAVVQGWLLDETWKISRDGFNFGEWLVKSYVPTIAHYAGTITFPWVKLYRAIDAEIEKYLPKVKHGAKGAVDGAEAKLGKLLRPLTLKEAADAAGIALLWAALGAIAGTLPHPGRIGSLPHGIGIPKSWTKWRHRVDARLRKLEGLFGATALAVAMANVLGVSAKCLRSGNVGKTARKLCGLGPRALEDLLGLLVDVLILENICNVITLREKGFALIEPEVTGFIATAEKQFVHCKYQLPDPLPAVPLSLPPVTGLALSLP